ncbi:metalloregulator ArsR/SmtB family transcription factor [Bacillus sp. FJAT-49736]|uniref:helix-turn-helix transcriptional regulator n=1 Tax=Bacillus sp. FJAT-49736 TaxID=2833582 RepID=UPI0020164F4B|nr:metalloregulator ArsR/SmtB family transcription factor [Bacillus sp. FJAT-49736]
MSTKDEIMHLLKKYKRLSVSELEGHLGITGMAVRRHLNQLEAEDNIKTETIRKNMGRPVQLYSLTRTGEEWFPKNYSAMTVDFLRDIEELSGPEMVDALFQKREARLEEKYKARIEDNDLKERVAVLADIQNENGYMVEWQENENGEFEFVEYNCPIFKVASNYHKACSCEHSLFQKVLQTDKVEQVCCMAKGGDFCKYVIKSS